MGLNTECNYWLAAKHESSTQGQFAAMSPEVLAYCVGSSVPVYEEIWTILHQVGCELQRSGLFVLFFSTFWFKKKKSNKTNNAVIMILFFLYGKVVDICYSTYGC